jgi:transketolase
MELYKIAREIRSDCLEMTFAAKSGHPGASLSIVEILVVLYFHVMKIDPANLEWQHRDRLILSKGHGCSALYSVLSKRGYFDRKYLNSFRKINSFLPGHPDSLLTPGIDASTGSLGMGLSMGIGMAIHADREEKDVYIYVIMGDGEQNEGQVWEGAMAAAHFQLGNLICFIDKNGSQVDGETDLVMSSRPLREKWQAFGWHVQEIDGHQFDEIISAVDLAKEKLTQPSMIIANTIKGRGVKSLENKLEVYGENITDEMANIFRNELAEVR